GGDGDDTLLGLDGDDIIQGGPGADIMDGGVVNDTLSYANATSGVCVPLNSVGIFGDATGDAMTGFEGLIGSAFNDRHAGDGGNKLADGGAGDGCLRLSGGIDTLLGGAGSDLLDGRVVGAGFIANLTT